MKRVLNFKSAVAFLMLMSTMMVFTAMDKAPAYDPVGIWVYEVETPDGTSTGDMTITKEEDGFGVVIETDQFGTLELEEVELDGNEMTGSVDLQGTPAEFEFEFDGDTMTGIVLFDGQELPIEAERGKKK